MINELPAVHGPSRGALTAKMCGNAGVDVAAQAPKGKMETIY
jgi:hypothetical protein